MIKSNRDLTIDFMRGILILIMILDHCFFFLFPDLHGQKITFELIGYCSAAEGFFFLAGYSVAKFYIPKIHSLGLGFVKNKIYSRAFKIYLIHLGLILLTFIIRPYFYNDTSFNFLYQHSVKELILSSILFYEPTLLDILPLYVMLFLITPFLLQKMAEKKTTLIFSLSIGLWFLGQINPFGRAYHGILFSFFDIFSWQLVYVLGIYSTQIVLPNGIKGKMLITLSSILVISGFLTHLLIGYKYQNVHWLLARNTMGPLRLINVVAIIYIASSIRPYISKILNHSVSNLIIRIGQNSLKVFVWHLIIMIIGSHWLTHNHLLTMRSQVYSLCIFAFIMILPIINPSFKSQVLKRMKSLNNYQ